MVCSRTFSLTPLLIAAILPLTFAQNGPNIIVNPGFETNGFSTDDASFIVNWGNSGYGDGWVAYDAATGAAASPPATVVSGQYSVRSYSNNFIYPDFLSQVFTNDSPTISCFVLAFDATSGGNTNINTFAFSATIGTQGINAQPFLIQSPDFVRVSTLLPVEAGAGQLVFAAYNFGTGYIALDNVYLAKAVNTIINSDNQCVCASGYGFNAVTESCSLLPTTAGSRIRTRSKRTKLAFDGVQW